MTTPAEMRRPMGSRCVPLHTFAYLCVPNSHPGTRREFRLITVSIRGYRIIAIYEVDDVFFDRSKSSHDHGFDKLRRRVDFQIHQLPRPLLLGEERIHLIHRHQMRGNLLAAVTMAGAFD